MTGRIDVELNKAALKALDIPNPEKKNNLKVHCITARSVKEVLAELHYKAMQSLSNHDNDTDRLIELHDAFVWANNELQLKGEN